MLFTTVPFVLFFLPPVLAVFYALGRFRPTAAAGWLFFASLVFYAFWLPLLTALLLASIAFNFVMGLRIARSEGRTSRLWLACAITLNLALLGYFKYANFFVDNVNALLGMDWQVGRIVLPIGISFYTFTQIAFLVDTYAGKVKEFNPIHYGLFVTYFPHLVAGPVLHHAQMMPQFAQPSTYRFDGANFAGGLFIFMIGLFKKVVLADGVSPFADAVFRAADGGSLPTTSEAWLGAVAYTLQLYFDFSGYSDMAIGLSWMFNVRLPANFDSPYKATNISDFWRRWHISLSNFLRDYLYIALGGNRYGEARRYANLMTTMVLGGLWHGAGWSFVLWGTLHGVYLMINHGFRALIGSVREQRLQQSRIAQVAGWGLTMLAVIVAWVFFRAESVSGALRILQAMFSLSAATSGPDPLIWNAGLDSVAGAAWCAVLGAMAVLSPNSGYFGERMRERLQGAHGVRWFVGTLALCLIGLLVLINTARDSVSAFIYFNF